MREEDLKGEDPDLEERRKSMEMELVTTRSPLRKKMRTATKRRRRTAVRVSRRMLRAGRTDPSPKTWSLRRRTTA